jgi:hypothetical protein
MFIFSTTRQVSGNTVQRYRTPTNPRTANAMTQFVFDHKNQAKVFPDQNPGALIEATQGQKGSSNYKTLNKSGQSAAQGALSNAFIGGLPDESGFQAKYFGK